MTTSENEKQGRTTDAVVAWEVEQAASERALSEPLAQQARCALATCSLPVSSEWVRYAAEEIAERAWQELQSGLYHLTTDAVEEIMRRHAARANQRQPEENKADRTT